MTEDKQVKIAALAKRLKLPLLAGFERHISREADFSDNLLRLLELEIQEKERRGIERRTKAAGFPIIHTLDTFEPLGLYRRWQYPTIPSGVLITHSKFILE